MFLIILIGKSPEFLFSSPPWGTCVMSMPATRLLLASHGKGLRRGRGPPFFTGDGKAAKLVIGGDHASEYTILYNKQPYNTTSIYLIYTIHTYIFCFGKLSSTSISLNFKTRISCTKKPLTRTALPFGQKKHHLKSPENSGSLS